MKPATPLPWKTLADIVVSVGGKSEITVADFMGALEPRLANSAYAAHACNAYPKLVEALREACFDLRRHEATVSASEAEQVLRELGELE